MRVVLAEWPDSTHPSKPTRLRMAETDRNSNWRYLIRSFDVLIPEVQLLTAILGVSEAKKNRRESL